MKALLAALAACAACLAQPAKADPYTIFLLDVSRSMEFPVARSKRIDFAKAALVDTLSSGRYPGAELLMWNTGKLREAFGDGATLAGQVRTAPKGDSGSDLGLAFMAISDAGTRCAHVVFVTDEYPDDPRNFRQAIDVLLDQGRQNTVTVYVVPHPEAYYYAGRFSDVSRNTRYRVVDGSRQGSLASYLETNPATGTCATLS